ncbi:uncharacterized protein LOC103857496 isoform X1 [Brassica rapa]|uniref:uncharacterized protein LOC103857496 isoform X1 n=1 Tax=Brassica campestris TaxID=3711 RepID=UPI00142D2891|nr:uncharacterized protein LOC103857496 isoform X1 [Brassica rapa]
MGSDWRRSMGNVRSFVGNSMGGLRGGQNLASWLVAGTIAYYLWVKPAQDLKKEQQARALLAVADANEYVEKRKPIADPQAVSARETSVTHDPLQLDPVGRRRNKKQGRPSSRRIT